MASSHSSGPAPASTMRPAGTIPEVFSSTCAAPTVITPGSVQPGIGNGRSCAPVARMTASATTVSMRRELSPPTATVSSQVPSSLLVTPITVADGTCVAPARRKRSISAAPCA